MSGETVGGLVLGSSLWVRAGGFLLCAGLLLASSAALALRPEPAPAGSEIQMNSLARDVMKQSFAETFIGSPTKSSNRACIGDCDDSSTVTVDEILAGVSIALGTLSLDHCARFDCDGIGRVTVGCIIQAVDAALNGCGSRPTVSPTATASPTPTSTPSPTPTPTRASIEDDAVVAASVRAATEPLLRLFEFQARVGTPGGVAGRSIVSGCQQFDCIVSGQVTGTEEDCCFGTQFTQVFDNCTFDDDLGRVVHLSGAFVLDSDALDVCTGAIPLGARFTASLSSFTHDISFPDGSFSRTFQELNETFEVTTGGCTVRQPEQLGFGIRGDGRRFIDGELRQFQSDGSGNVLVDTETEVSALAMEVRSTGVPDDCTVTAALRGSVTSADFRVGTQFSTDFTGLQIVQPPQAGALLLGLNGTVGSDCLGQVTLSTVEPLRLAPGDICFTAGRLNVPVEGGTVSVTYAESGLDLDFGADGSVEQHLASCTDVPATDKCITSAVGLCGACTAVDQCQGGLSCFPCSDGCTGTTSRCSFSDAFVTCEDGVF